MEFTEEKHESTHPTQPQTIQLAEAPNATLILVFGILSIVFCGIIGLGFGITALIMANKSKETYSLNPALYTNGSISNVNAGRICGIIGIVLGSIITLFIIAYVIFIFAILGGLAASGGTGWI
ncbi:MAG: hypothetical protein HND27_06200 [Bacteroidetes bacterium]|nr:hypothetical protein [Bacteroidota bacterium]MBV6459958.1 hypothetical protein [Flavobacteriales bacterium]WKZ76397.1 MAG: CCC motif membrane protein [Vicingaceae bacterium]MCL4816318.1 DUF4190 domain-containing protein [Flavobacteriales bacterium]NOG95354.1 hypothetical protein [Bacteroidota bacterium]